jgi:regulator of sirC expression with transglutaminase-like and TPR domain
VAKDPGQDAALAARIDAVNRYLFGEIGFADNVAISPMPREQFDDPRNSCLNQVMDRKRGIPITMALIYIEVARRAGLRAEGVNFPGHFLVRVLPDHHTGDPREGLIVDRFTAAPSERGRLPAASAAPVKSAFEPSPLARATAGRCWSGC